MKVSITIEDKGLTKRLQRMRKEIDTELAKEISRATADTSRMAKSFAPINFGRLKNAIRSRTKAYTGDIIADVKYAPYQEFGTGNKVNVPAELKDYAMTFKGKGLRTVNTQAQPYLYPAFFITRSRLKGRINNMLRKITH